MQRTPDDIANEAIMTRNGCKSVILLVEGYNDEKIFRKFLSEADSEIIDSWGKHNLLSAIEILQSQSLDGVLGIVDADFWHLDGQPKMLKNVVVTDEHDLEMMIVRSKSFSNFILEITSNKKLQSFLLSHNVQDIREILLRLALPIGYLRRYSHITKLNLRFEGLKFNTFIDKETLNNIDVTKMIESVLALTREAELALTRKAELVLTRKAELNVQEITDQIQILLNGMVDDPYQICCGHDVIEILSVGVRKCIGSRTQEAASRESLERELRMSYDSSCFCQTKLYKAAKEWSLENAPYKIFF